MSHAHRGPRSSVRRRASELSASRPVEGCSGDSQPRRGPRGSAGAPWPVRCPAHPVSRDAQPQPPGRTCTPDVYWPHPSSRSGLRCDTLSPPWDTQRGKSQKHWAAGGQGYGSADVQPGRVRTQWGCPLLAPGHAAPDVLGTREDGSPSLRVALGLLARGTRGAGGPQAGAAFHAIGHFCPLSFVKFCFLWSANSYRLSCLRFLK